VKGVRFPAYMDQIDFPYFKMFTEKKPVQKKQVFIDQVKKEKAGKEKTGDGVLLSFIPVFDKDIFDDDVVEKFKLYLVNHDKVEYSFNYKLMIGGKPDFQLLNTLDPLSEFYLHDIPFEDLSDAPRFDFEFSLKKPDKKKAPYLESSLKLKAKQLFRKIEETKMKNEASFVYRLFEFYPDKAEQEKVDLSKLGNAGFRIYQADQISKNLEPPRSVVDLHIDKLLDKWEQLDTFEILHLQLQAFEKYFELAVAHRQRTLTVIHGIGEGRLKEEIHELLKQKKEVRSFVNQFSHLYGYGATEIYFEY
jgi:hypothetical protein